MREFIPSGLTPVTPKPLTPNDRKLDMLDLLSMASQFLVYKSQYSQDCVFVERLGDSWVIKKGDRIVDTDGQPFKMVEGASIEALFFADVFKAIEAARLIGEKVRKVEDDYMKKLHDLASYDSGAEADSAMDIIREKMHGIFEQ